MELSSTNDSWLHHISSYVKYLTAGLFVAANDEDAGNKYVTPVWEICKFSFFWFFLSQVAMIDTQHNLHFTSVTVLHLHYRHSAGDNSHLLWVSM